MKTNAPPAPALAAARPIDIARRTALTVMGRYTPAQVQWHYEHGLVLQSVFMLGERLGREDYCGWVRDMYGARIGPEGGIDSYRKDDYNLDFINPGNTLFLLYKKYGDARYRAAIETLRGQLASQPRTKAGGFWHKQVYPWQMWLDGLYMEGPFYARYLTAFAPEDEAGFGDLVHQFTLMYEKAADPVTGLLYHAWDESCSQKWASQATGRSPHFWGRAMGWYCMALVDVIDILRPSRPEEAAVLENIAKRLAAPVLAYQDNTSGLWYQVLDKAGLEGNYTESSASSMFVRFLFALLRLGLAPDAPRVREAAQKGWRGLLAGKVTEDAAEEVSLLGEPFRGLHLTGICKVAGLGGNPYRDGSYGYYISEPVVTDDFKGLGPFIQAALEADLA